MNAEEYKLAIRKVLLSKIEKLKSIKRKLKTKSGMIIHPTELSKMHASAYKEALGNVPVNKEDLFMQVIDELVAENLVYRDSDGSLMV